MHKLFNNQPLLIINIFYIFYTSSWIPHGRVGRENLILRPSVLHVLCELRIAGHCVLGSGRQQSTLSCYSGEMKIPVILELVVAVPLRHNDIIKLLKTQVYYNLIWMCLIFSSVPRLVTPYENVFSKTLDSRVSSGY